MRLGEVRDEVEVLAVGRRDAERLLHQPVRLVPVPVRLAVVVVLVAAAARLGRLARALARAAEAATALPFHLAVRQEASGHPACAPRLAVRPPPHARLPLVPHEHRPGPDRLPLLLR